MKWDRVVGFDMTTWRTSGVEGGGWTAQITKWSAKHASPLRGTTTWHLIWDDGTASSGFAANVQSAKAVVSYEVNRLTREASE